MINTFVSVFIHINVELLNLSKSGPAFLSIVKITVSLYCFCVKFIQQILAKIDDICIHKGIKMV